MERRPIHVTNLAKIETRKLHPQIFKNYTIKRIGFHMITATKLLQMTVRCPFISEHIGSRNPINVISATKDLRRNVI